MTRLVEWLTVGCACFGLWWAIVAGLTPFKLSGAQLQVIIALPVYMLIAFGCFSLALIGYRVYGFNDCVDAAKNLQKEISEARVDLKKKGFSF